MSKSSRSTAPSQEAGELPKPSTVAEKLAASVLPLAREHNDDTRARPGRFSNRKRHPEANEPTLAEQNERLITRALAIVDEQIAASEVLREVERLRAENKRLAAVELEHARLLEPFTQPTDGTSAHTGVLQFVAHQLTIQGWAAGDDDNSSSFVVLEDRGADTGRHFRFLASLVTMAARWADAQCEQPATQGGAS